MLLVVVVVHILPVVVTCLSAPPRVAVIGAGWGGLGAAKALAENGCAVTVIDGGNPLRPMRTTSGKPFEPGTRGFWFDYPNINALGEELKIGDAYTPFTESSFFGPFGLECTAPVFSGGAQPELPSPLGQVFASFDRFTRLPLLDRLSILGLFGAMADLRRSPEVFERYDRMTAHELFLRVGVTKRLVDDFLKPTLLVGLFKPPEELSAAVTMELLYYYALAHQTSFDVRWLKKGTVSSVFFEPLIQDLREKNVTFKFDAFAKKLHYDAAEDRVAAVETDSSEMEEVDAVVLALGANGLRAVMNASPELAQRCPELAATASLGAIDVVAARLYFDTTIHTDTPVGVFSKFPQLRGAGGTFFMLDQLQKDHLEELWGGGDVFGSVVACDFYNAAAIAPLSDEAIKDLLAKDLLPAAYPAFRAAELLDFHVQRFPKAVSWFAPGSAAARPPLRTSLPNVVCAGDLVTMGDREFGAKGLCQERALVSGYQAANELAATGVLSTCSKQRSVIPIRPDEPLYLAAVRLNKALQDSLLKPLNLDSFWVR
mmetsp:Transcript_14360/g.43475  ORF Transcript_14360/g.43475 Transcript_14360/m.43475 type:complete len:543 (+) Transcript_14360:92-1720(+)